ncbi:MAG: adenosine deaminase family protein [Kiritimatiellae bacterium]|nr:adenosine deaminase family protein [Kiritimatiellia bacterium]
MATQRITREFLRQLPKTDLHLHLDGSIRIATLIELAREAGVALPSETEEGLRETVFKEHYENLEQYLRGFGYTTKVMQQAESIERIAYELGVDNQAEGVRYIEVRFAPQLHTHKDFDIVDTLRAVSNGLARAKQAFNVRPEVVSGAEPPFDYAIIACAMRYFDERFSSYYRTFLGLLRYGHPAQAYAQASLELAQAAIHARREEGLPVSGLDLAGPEKGYPPHHHRGAYEHAHRGFLHKTVHAGEDYGPESIFEAITELHADRVGHATSLFNPAAIQNPAIADRERYVEELTQYIAARRITLEVCLTSNQQTQPAYRELARHPFGEMMKKRLSVSLCTDSRTVSNTTVTDEVYKAVTTFGLSRHELKNILVYGFKRSFFPGDYAKKRAYVRTCMDYFDRLWPANE